MSELKLCMYDVPVLSHIGMVPYLYANLILPGVFNTNIKLMDKSRSSIGLGIRWVTMLGKIDFNYSAKSFSKAGDVGTEFQVLFAD